MKIYTKTGDKGQTSLYGGKRVGKNNPLVETYGTIDELNSVLGILVSLIAYNPEIKSFIQNIQSDLLIIGTYIAGNNSIPLNKLAVRTTQMEKLIDKMEGRLSPLKNFIIPGGTQSAAYAHFSRSLCRRAERKVIRLINMRVKIDNKIIIYLNRLSDLLFVIARYLNFQSGISDIIWKG